MGLKLDVFFSTIRGQKAISMSSVSEDPPQRCVLFLLVNQFSFFLNTVIITL